MGPSCPNKDRFNIAFIDRQSKLYRKKNNPLWNSTTITTNDPINDTSVLKDYHSETINDLKLHFRT